MSKNNKRPIILDCDPGIDDAVAIALALFEPTLDLKLISTVAGNVSIDLVTENALKLLGLYGRTVPVAKGARFPLNEPFTDASDVHGASGLEGYEFPKPNSALLHKDHAVEAMYQTIMESEKKVTLVPIAPLTNLALLFKTHPDCLSRIEEIVMMGGSYTRGNKGVMSEFNIGTDPEAADIVFQSGLPITMVGLEIGAQALVPQEDSDEIKTMNVIGDMFYHLFKKYRSGSFAKGLKIYDATAIAYLAKPEMFKTQEAFVGIELTGTYTRGATVCDLQNRLGKPKNVNVCLEIDGIEFRKWMKDSIRNMDIE